MHRRVVVPNETRSRFPKSHLQLRIKYSIFREVLRSKISNPDVRVPEPTTLSSPILSAFGRLPTSQNPPPRFTKPSPKESK